MTIKLRFPNKAISSLAVALLAVLVFSHPALA